VNRAVQEPLAITLAGEYDIWDKRDPRTDFFQYGLNSREINFDTLLKDDSSYYVDLLVESGRLVKFYVDKSNASIITKQGFDVQFEGYTFLAVNAARYNSMLFDAGLKPHHQGCLGFHWDGQAKVWKISMYGTPTQLDIDFSVIASKYGGGGHARACGFRCKVPPFPLIP
jgi:oligoribonuclease NrnB/cAMP/cGMP phosphodiesterase (DHH superfamily)